MVAKQFFYACAGLLCLALAYHLGARNATAYVPGSPVADFWFPGALSAVNGSTYYQWAPGTSTPQVILDGVPAHSPVIACSGSAIDAWVCLENGEVWTMSHGGSTEYPSWTHIANIWPGATSATQETWGGMKARYRQPGAAAPRGK